MNTKSLSVSLIIPCYHKHAKYLYKLLIELEKQTVLPDEIILALSGTKRVSKRITRKIKEREWRFPLKLELSEEECFCGVNRNRGSEKAKGDIIMLQDADDFTHPQRVEITKYLFETYELNHLIVGCGRVDYSKTFNLESLSREFFDDFSKTWSYGPLQYGCVSIRREVFSEIQWPVQQYKEDIVFNEAAYEKFNNCMVLFDNVYEYRGELSGSLSFIERIKMHAIKWKKDMRYFLGKSFRFIFDA